MCGWRLFHKWGKFEDLTVVYTSVSGDLTYRRPAQRRHCERCGKVQVEEIEL